MKISCQVSELSGTKGNTKIVRRKLTKVKEEDDDDDDDQDQCGTSSGVNNNAAGIDDSLQYSSYKSLSPRDDDDDDIGAFMRKHRASRRSDKQRAKLAAPSSNSNANATPTGAQQAVDDNKVHCFELFCIHQSSLLVNRNQPLVEAEKLARRLALLSTGPDSE